MMDANIVSVFVGIESPDDDALLETKKLRYATSQAPSCGASTAGALPTP
jgi:hypothetical protein